MTRFSEIMALVRQADAICRREPGHGTPAYRGDPYEAVAIYQRAERLAGRV